MCLTGRRLDAVSYRFPAHSDAAASYEVLPGVHQVSGVDLVVGGDVLHISWRMQGFREGLGLKLLPRLGDPGPAVVAQVVDVSGAALWAQLLGRTVRDLGCSWFGGASREEDASAAIWSIRFDFDVGGSVVVSLGEVTPETNEVTYMPDTLVVFDDESKARAYFLVDAVDSAWGASLFDA